MKKLTSLCTASILALAAQQASAADLEIQVQNLTQGIYFTPLLVTAHPADASLFTVGEAASSALQKMAEGGAIADLEAIVTGVNANSAANPAQGLLAPSKGATAMITNAAANTKLSIVGMMLPTNDGFVGLDSWTIPTEAGTYTVFLNGYDAGTEANNELRGSGAPGEAGMPVPPPLDPLLGNGGTGVTDMEPTKVVHIHRGNLGDSDTAAGSSDINSSVQRWLNPVAKVTVTVK